MTTATAALRGPLRKRESNLWQREANDWYVEPEWCSLRLFQEEKFELAAGGKPGNGTTDYAWFVWLRGYDGAPEVRWLRREA